MQFILSLCRCPPTPTPTPRPDWSNQSPLASTPTTDDYKGSMSLFTIFNYFSVSHEEFSDVDFVLDQNLLHYDGDNITLLWTPSDIISPDLVSPVLYSVNIEVYWYNIHNDTWNYFKGLANNLNNSGIAANLSTLFGMDGVTSDYVVPIAFRIVPRIKDYSLVPDFLRPFLEQDRIGIWSSVAYKVIRNGQEHLLSGLCHVSIQQLNMTSGDETLLASVPCPCNARQARRVNSGFFELISQRRVRIRKLFNPDADSCFVSQMFGYAQPIS